MRINFIFYIYIIGMAQRVTGAVWMSARDAEMLCGPGPVGGVAWQTVHVSKAVARPCSATNLRPSLGSRLGAMAWVLS